jgi:dynein heavy chain
LTPQDVASESGDSSGGPAKKVKDYIEKIPELIDRFMLKQKIKADMGNPMNVVLQQEVERYEGIIRMLMADLDELEQGLRGMKAITPYLENIVNCINLNEVPAVWAKGYFTMKPLSNWFDDLRQRYEFFEQWAIKGTPFVFWLGAFTFPTGFTTSLMQRFSRKANSAPIDQLTFEFTPMNRPPHEI